MSTVRRDPTADIARLEADRKTMSTPRGELSYFDTGARDGVPAVFVHGVGTNALLWRNVIAALGDTKRTIALNVAGALVGTHVQQRLSGRTLTLAFAALLAVIGVRLIAL